MAQLFEVTILGTMQAQLIVNRLNFVSDIDDPDGATASSLMLAMGYASSTTVTANSLFDRLLEAQTTQYQINEIQVRNLYNVIDFITFPVGSSGWAGTITVGAGAGPLMFAAQKLKTNRVRTDIRAGTLALTSPSEAEIEGAGVVTSGQLTKLTAICTVLNAPMSDSSGAATVYFRPSVLQKEAYDVPQAPPKLDTVAYRYYEDKDDQLMHTALSVTWSADPQITSQVSRKIGKGA